jgi:AcrR family transcriptional regulator
MTSRRYVSPVRDARARATRKAILEAFAAQFSDPACERLSPSLAAKRAGVSLRTVHFHFPNEDSQIMALGEWLDGELYPDGVALCAGPDDLVRYFRDIHRLALKHPLSRVLIGQAMAPGRSVWKAVRERRRTERLEAIRQAVKAIGAPPHDAEEATAMLLSLSGSDASWPLHDHGLALERVPDVIANTVELIVAQLRTKV